ncbi:hypothetical protein BJ878DRAFT_190896 [Calycina marina]|uniref:Uncharacterized protein n=1 Tax=Calycina marina TaxID=1763456 RepID=A0A9P7Z916_9HELO|nr:hypothetical protein BJ878DRAFT_190896 [Calycina marina]
MSHSSEKASMIARPTARYIKSKGDGWELVAKAKLPAHAKCIYNLILDTLSWPDWNPLMPKCHVLNGSPILKPHSKASMDIYDRGRGFVHGAKKDRSMKFEVKRLKTKQLDDGRMQYRIVWQTESYHTVTTRRVITVVERSPGGIGCDYSSHERFWGFFAMTAKNMHGQDVLEGARKMAEGLQKYQGH